MGNTLYTCNAGRTAEVTTNCAATGQMCVGTAPNAQCGEPTGGTGGGAGTGGEPAGGPGGAAGQAAGGNATFSGGGA
jgi:hypothetical protein